MSNKKKSFILHHDSLGILKKLDDEQAGKLFKAITEYSCNGEIDCDLQTELLLFPFQSQFDRDNEAYQKVVERNKSNGSKGGRPKNPKEPKEPSGLNGLDEKPKKADSVNVNDSDKGSDNKRKEIYQQIADEFNSNFPELPQVMKINPQRIAGINACIKEFKKTHDLASIETWKGLFDYMKGSDFLMGRSSDWCCDFDFIITKSKLLKVIEGKYENNNGQS